ncbi:MAG: head-tail adaptor protein [Lachnospiraceae bacterium]|nr:head-tail adaptor protein [Lachnospiraceae bacterium]
MINAGKYNRKIKIYRTSIQTDTEGFQTEVRELVVETYASVKTTKGMTIIKNDSDFEKALTNFTIRFPKAEINRDMIVVFKDKRYSIEYLNNVNEENVELEMQCKEITH